MIKKQVEKMFKSNHSQRQIIYRSLISIFLFISATNISFCQTEHKLISLSRHIGRGPFQGAIKPTILDSAVVAIKTPDFIKDYIIKHIAINDVYNKKVLYYFLVGNTLNGGKVIIYDKNRDFDFTNDSVLQNNYIDKRNNDSIIVLKLYYAADTSQYFIIEPIIKQSSFKYFNADEQDKYLMVGTYEYYNADFEFDNTNYSIYALNATVTPNFRNNYYTQLMIKTQNSTNYLKIGHPQRINDIIIEPISISKYGDTLLFNIYDTLQSSLISGANEGFKFAEISLLDVNNSQLEIPVKGKYTLLDFWGTWCAPCKKLTPGIKKISDNRNKNLDIVGIAFDDDTLNVLKYIKSKKLYWHQIIANKSNTNIRIIEFCDVNNYPTFILINPAGVVIGRYIGLDDFGKLKEKLEELGLISN